MKQLTRPLRITFPDNAAWKKFALRLKNFSWIFLAVNICHPRYQPLHWTALPLLYHWIFDFAAALMTRMELHPTQQLRCSHERPFQTHPMVPQSVGASRPRSAAPRGSDRPQRAKARPHLMKARGHQAPPLAPCPTPGPSSRSQGNDVPPLTSHPRAELRRARGGMTPTSGRDADASPPADGAAPRPWRRRHDVTPPAVS